MNRTKDPNVQIIVHKDYIGVLCLRCGADMDVKKPITQEELDKKMKEFKKYHTTC